MSKRRGSAVLGAASVLMLAAGVGGFSDSETAATSVASGTLILGLDASGGASSNDCANTTRGANGEVPLDLTDQDDRDAYTVDRVLCLRNLGSGAGVAALRVRVDNDAEAGCEVAEGRAELGRARDGEPADSDCGTDGELDGRFRAGLLTGAADGGRCDARGDVLVAAQPIRGLEAAGPTRLFEIPAAGLACVVLRVEADNADATMMTDVVDFTVSFELESR